MLIGKRKNISENQVNILSAVGCEQKNRHNRERNVVLFGVPNSTAATEEEREKEDEKTTREIFEEIGLKIEYADGIKKYDVSKVQVKQLHQPIRFQSEYALENFTTKLILE